MNLKKPRKTIFEGDESQKYFKVIQKNRKLFCNLYGRTDLAQDVVLMSQEVVTVQEALDLASQYVNQKLDHFYMIIPTVKIQANFFFSSLDFPEHLFTARCKDDCYEYRVLGQLKFSKVSCHLSQAVMVNSLTLMLEKRLLPI